MEAINNFLTSTGFFQFTQGDNWKCLIMILISCVLLFLGIKKKFEPLLLVPIAIGMLVTNLPGSGMFHEILFAGGHVHWDIFQGEPITASFLSEMFSAGVSADVLQPYVDSLWTTAQSLFDADALNQAAAQIAAASGDVASSIAVQIQTLASAEQFAAASGVTLSNVTVSVGLIDVLYLGIKLGIYPCLIFMGVGAMTDFGPLIACLMLGNLAKECGVLDRLSKTMQNELMNIVTIFLGISVGATATAATFLSPKTLAIMGMGVVAFGFGTAGGVLLAKFMNLFLKEKINPLIGSAGVSAVPMAARVSQKVGQQYNPGNFLLMHAMGPNVAGVIGSAIAAGVLISLYG